MKIRKVDYSNSPLIFHCFQLNNMKIFIIITLLALIVSTDTFTLPTSNNQLIRTHVSILSSTVVNEYSFMTTLSRHPHNNDANDILEQTEEALQSMQETILLDSTSTTYSEDDITNEEDIPIDVEQESVYANSYVDLGKVDTVGFDYDYTLVTYTQALLELIYDMALNRLVNDLEYPKEMLTCGLKFDPMFSIRGLAVDKENGWICHLDYAHRVGVAWEGRHRVLRKRLIKEYSGKRSLSPSKRRARLKPLNDLFSMAECCLMADTVQYFLDGDIPFCPRSAVNDVLGSITKTHISGNFHKVVAENPAKYFEEKPHLKEVLNNFKKSGKRLIFVR